MNSPLIGDGYCNDELNTRHCDFDGADCCLKTPESHETCEEFPCWRDYNPHKKNITIVEEYVEQPHEMCIDFNGTLKCHLKAAVAYGGKSGTFQAYKSVEFDDGTEQILKCKDPLYTKGGPTVPHHVGM